MTGVATATVAASLLAIGCSGASGTSAPTAGGSSAVATTTTSQNLLCLLGNSDRPLSAGVYLLDLTALELAPDRPAHVPKIALTLPSGWQSYHGYAVTKDRGGADVMGLAFWDVDQVTEPRADGSPSGWSTRVTVLRPGGGPFSSATSQRHSSNELRSVRRAG